MTLSKNPNDMTATTYVSLLSDESDSSLTAYDISVQPKRDATTTARTRCSPFRFLDLPAELRVAVYHYLLPWGLVISFSKRSIAAGTTCWWVWGLERVAHGTLKSKIPPASLNNPLFLVNKFVSSEARAVLYGENTFLFTVDGLPHRPISIASPLIFGPLGSPSRIHLLRNLRNVELVVCLDNNSSWVVKRHRGRLDHFVNIIKEHADDDKQKSLLKYFKVRLVNNVFSYSDKFMFGLESLASLRGIKEVEITGVPYWYAKCLELCIQGTGGEVEKIDYPLVEIKRRRDHNRKTKKFWVTTKKWYQPALNWKEFAERNDITVPEDIDRFWIAYP